MSIAADGWQIYVELIHLYRDAMRIYEQATGVSQTRFQILHELFHTAEISQAELQKRLAVEGAVMTRIVKQLEAAGLVTRRPDPQDNRYTLVTMTPQARDVRNQSDSATFMTAFGTQLVNGLSEEDRAQLIHLLQQLQANVETMRTSDQLPRFSVKGAEHDEG